jgi:hypothetical protein
MAKVNRPDSVQTYRTPPELLAAVERKFGRITFDLACTSEDCVADEGFCIDRGHDALTEDWEMALGTTIGDGLGWCNPMWKDAGKYAQRASACPFRRVLLNCQLAPDTTWYRDYVHPHARVFALIPRVPYLKPDGTPAFVDKRGKPLGINRPVMVAAYGFGLEPGLEMWSWKR